MSAPIPLVPKWRQALARDAKDIPLATAANALSILANDPELRAVFARNVFNAETVLTKPLPLVVSGLAPQPGIYPRQWMEPDIFILQAYLQRFYTSKFTFEIAERAMKTVAGTAAFHPVLQWLAAQVWDGKPRIDAWLINAFGANDTPYVRAVGSKFLLAAVRRVAFPGCQFDHMLVLEGPQGIGKSTAFRALFGDQWFTDDMPHDLTSKDSSQSLLGVWGIEVSEIAQLVGRRNGIETVKAFLTRRADRFRPPYGRGFILQPRQMIFIGTTNRDDWLSDETGNRRFWPVACPTADTHWVAVNRDQLWAEAAYREAAGESNWLETSELQADAAMEQEKRLLDEVWTPRIQDYLAGRSTLQIGDLLTTIGVPVDKQDKATQMRAAKAVSKEGWVRETRWDQKSGKAQKLWARSSIVI